MARFGILAGVLMLVARSNCHLLCQQRLPAAINLVSPKAVPVFTPVSAKLICSSSGGTRANVGALDASFGEGGFLRPILGAGGLLSPILGAGGSGSISGTGGIQSLLQYKMLDSLLNDESSSKRGKVLKSSKHGPKTDDNIINALMLSSLLPSQNFPLLSLLSGGSLFKDIMPSGIGDITKTLPLLSLLSNGSILSKRHVIQEPTVAEQNKQVTST